MSWLVSMFRKHHILMPQLVCTAAVRGVPPQVPTMSPPAAATPPTLPPLPPPPQDPGPPAPSPPPLPPTSMRILSNMFRVGLLSTQRNRFVPATFHYHFNCKTYSFVASCGYSQLQAIKQIYFQYYCGRMWLCSHLMNYNPHIYSVFHFSFVCVCVWQTNDSKGIETTWRGSHHGEHLHVWELHRAQKPPFLGQSLWNPSDIAWAEVRTAEKLNLLTCKCRTHN